MLTVIYITHRGLFPLVDSNVRYIGQYDLLSACLKEQTFKDFELIVVDKDNTLPRPEFHWLENVTFLRPRETPWTSRGTFCANSARNTALVYAKGSVIVGMDDCYSFHSGYLKRISDLADRGIFAVSHVKSPSWPARPDGPLPTDQYGGGIIAYPLRSAIEINGYDERFDGCYTAGDIDFFERLRLNGVKFERDQAIYVEGYNHGRRSCVYYRCWRLAWNLAQRRHSAKKLTANAPWTIEESKAWETCGRQLDPPQCSLSVVFAILRDRKIVEPETLGPIMNQI